MNALAISHQIEKTSADFRLPTIREPIAKESVLSRLKYRLPRCHTGKFLGATSAARVNDLMYCLNHDIRSVILDVVPTPLGDDPCSSN